MPKLTEEDQRRLIEDFIVAHGSSYTTKELDYIRKNWLLKEDLKSASDLLRQLYDELGLLEKKDNMYEGFIELLDENFNIDQNIVEIAGGIIPSLSKHLALRQKSGTVTVYDPRLIEKINTPSNLILKRESFTRTTSLAGADMLIAFMPCETTNLAIETACKNNLDFMIGLCEGGSRPGYEWLETDEEWFGYVEYNAKRWMRSTTLGDLKKASLKEYGDPYPVIYNKRRP